MTIVETITNNDRRFISAAAGQVLIPLTAMVMDVVDNVELLSRDQHVLILTDAGLELPPGLPAEDLVSPAMSLVQNEWYRAVRGEVPAKVLANHEDRMRKLSERVAFIKANPPKPEPVKPAREPKPPKEPKAPKEKAPAKSYTYELLGEAIYTSKTLALYLDMKNPAKSHDGIIVQELERIGEPVGLDELVKEVEATKRYETNDPLAKSVKWHLNKLVEKGYVKVTEL